MSANPAMKKRGKRDGDGTRDFLIGVLWGAWFLHSSHGEDTYAEELLDNMGSVESLQRLARAEQYNFSRAFWVGLRHRRRLRDVR